MIIKILVFVEAAFYATYLFYLKPRATDISRNRVKPYRDYTQNGHPSQRRHLMCVRILERIEASSHSTQLNVRANIENFLKSWFYFDEMHEVKNEAEGAKVEGNSSFNKSSSAERSKQSDAIIDLVGIKEFFSFALFDKFFHQLEIWEKTEIDMMINFLKKKYGIFFQEEKRSIDEKYRPYLTPRSFTLEEGNPLHRPFIFYFGIWIIRHFSYILLRLLGYQRFHANCSNDGIKKLPYWYKAGCSNGVSCPDAILFFHGISPAGVMGYLPMLRHCLKANESSPLFLFENLSISYNLSFETLTEEETAFGVEDALNFHHACGKNRNLVLFGHSFGSFQLTWLIKSARIRPMIKKVIVLDPVSILLSNPDVVVNFLYNGDDSIKGTNKYNAARFIMRLAASSELFIQNYLRRHFAWHNSELWVEDIPDHVDMHIYLSENDAIIDADKVRREIERHQRKGLNYTFWTGRGHGDCIIDPDLWDEISSSFNSHNKTD
jgi:pimeloyl-ACP methyl ester carboxylesterase